MTYHHRFQLRFKIRYCGSKETRRDCSMLILIYLAKTKHYVPLKPRWEICKHKVRTVCMLKSRHQDRWTKPLHKIANKSFVNVAKFEHFRMTVTNQNCIHKKLEHISFGECLLPFIYQCFVLPSAILICYDHNRPNYACYLVSHCKKNRDWGNTWTCEGWRQKTGRNSAMARRMRWTGKGKMRSVQNLGWKAWRQKTTWET